MRIRDFELKIYKLEEIIVVIREKRLKDYEGLDYNYERKLEDDKKVYNLRERIKESINKVDSSIEFEILNGSGSGDLHIHNRIALGTVRNSYVK